MFRYFAAATVLVMSMAGALIGAAPAMATPNDGVPKPRKAHVKPHKAQVKPRKAHVKPRKAHAKPHKAHAKLHKAHAKHHKAHVKHHKAHKKHHKFNGFIKIHKRSDNDKFSNKSIQYCDVYVASVVSDGPISGDCTHRPWQENEGDENEFTILGPRSGAFG